MEGHSYPGAIIPPEGVPDPKEQVHPVSPGGCGRALIKVTIAGDPVLIGSYRIMARSSGEGGIRMTVRKKRNPVAGSQGRSPSLREQRMNADEVVARLRSLAQPGNLAGMARFGIPTEHALGISLPVLRKLARGIGRDHALAGDLWATGIHEARILATLVDDPKQVSDAQMEAWVLDFHSWDLCDQCCSNLFDRTPHAYRKVREWSSREEEFVKRAGFVLMATLSVHDKKADDIVFREFFPIIVREATDDRIYVKKAVNWALRQIGKRNRVLNREAFRIAEEIRTIDSRAARWIASDALRELTGEEVQRRLKEKS
jgi:3-methyladenine DNA glycosylase AlkD